MKGVNNRDRENNKYSSMDKIQNKIQNKISSEL